MLIATPEGVKDNGRPGPLDWLQVGLIYHPPQIVSTYLEERKVDSGMLTQCVTNMRQLGPEWRLCHVLSADGGGKAHLVGPLKAPLGWIWGMHYDGFSLWAAMAGLPNGELSKYPDKISASVAAGWRQVSISVDPVGAPDGTAVCENAVLLAGEQPACPGMYPLFPLVTGNTAGVINSSRSTVGRRIQLSMTGAEAPETPEVGMDMTPEALAAAIAEANKPLLEGINALGAKIDALGAEEQKEDPAEMAEKKKAEGEQSADAPLTRADLTKFGEGIGVAVAKVVMGQIDKATAARDLPARADAVIDRAVALGKLDPATGRQVRLSLGAEPDAAQVGLLELQFPEISERKGPRRVDLAELAKAKSWPSVEDANAPDQLTMAVRAAIGEKDEEKRREELGKLMDQPLAGVAFSQV